MKIKVTETNSDYLTEGKEYNVEDLRISQGGESGEGIIVACDIMDDDGDQYTIVNFDEATYEIIEV